RATAASTNSTGEIFPLRTSSACAVASSQATSSVIAGAYERARCDAWTFPRPDDECTPKRPSAREAEQAFADDRALDLAAAAGDGRCLRPQPLPLPRPGQRPRRAL